MRLSAFLFGSAFANWASERLRSPKIGVLTDRDTLKFGQLGRKIIIMKVVHLLTVLAIAICATVPRTVHAQPLTVTTLAGQFGHSGGRNGVGTNAQFSDPQFPSNLA